MKLYLPANILIILSFVFYIGYFLIYLKKNSKRVLVVDTLCDIIKKKRFFSFELSSIAAHFLLIPNLIIIALYINLLYLFILPDYTISSVFFHSSSIAPVIYRIGATWASHETSLVFFTAVNSFVFLLYFYYVNNRIFHLSHLFFSIIQLFILFIVFASANPFLVLQTVPKEGMGLNPLLQDRALLIHPPVLYFSYSLYLIIYISSLAQTFKHNIIDEIKLRQISRLALITIISSIGLGGWWAYRELGWGGYWYFDPVENISLSVAIMGIAYHHTLLQANMPRLKSIIGVLPFLSAFVGTFLVRSGLLTSVHSFAESNSVMYFLYLAIMLTLVTFVILIKQNLKLEIHHAKSNKYFLMLAGNILWLLSFIIIFSTLFFPIIYENIYNEKIELSVNFFVNSLLPIMLSASALSGIIYFNRKIKILYFLIPFSIALSFIYYFLTNCNFINVFAFFVGVIVLIGTVIRFYEKYHEGKISNSSTQSMLISHLGISFLILFILFNTQYSQNYNLALKVGNKVTIGENMVEFVQQNYSNGENYFRQIAKLRIFNKNGDEIVTLNPELRFYPIEKSVTSDADIYSFVTSDWYATISNSNNDEINLEIYYRPLISFIWLSIAVIVFGTFIGTLK